MAADNDPNTEWSWLSQHVCAKCGKPAEHEVDIPTPKTITHLWMCTSCFMDHEHDGSAAV